MSYKIEGCEVAKEMLLPYMAGELDGTPHAQEFEAHTQKCQRCQELIRDKRKAIQVLLASAEEKVATHHQTRPQVPSFRALSSNKVLLIAGAAALAMIGFGYFMKPTSGFLGETVAESFKTNPSLESKSTSPTESFKTEETTSESTIEQNTGNTPPTSEESVAPKDANTQTKITQNAQKPITRQKPNPTTTQKHPQKVVVYDENGRPIGEATGQEQR